MPYMYWNNFPAPVGSGYVLTVEVKHETEGILLF